MNVTYCELWSNESRSATDVMTAEAARARDAAGESYCVVLGDVKSPDAVIEVVPENDYINVSFIDEEGRTHMAYGFEKFDDKTFFMDDVTLWSYPEGARDESEASRVESLEYRPDGYGKYTVDDDSSETVQVSERTEVPLRQNWEPAPQFGEWASIARKDRSVPAGQ